MISRGAMMNYKVAIAVAIEVVLIAISIIFFAPLGYMGIEVEPKGAQVKIDGDPAGRSPLYLAFVTPRKYQLEISKDGYKTLNASFNVSRFTKTIQQFKLEKVYSYEILSDPPGAYVILDGKLLQETTPMKIKGLTAGKYLLILQKEGYPSISKVIETSQSKASFLLSFRQGINVEFTSNPPGAELRLDGKKVGVTPCIVEGLFAKTYNAELTIEGYEDLKQSVDISINGDKVSFTLRKLNPLAIISDPPGQIAYLDGNPAGKTPLIVNIVDGRYEIAVGKIKKQVVLPKDQIVKIENPEKAIFELINESGTVQKYQGPSDAVLPKPPNGKYRLAIPIEGGRIYLSEYTFADKPQKVSSYTYSKDGKTTIRSIGGARSIEIVTPKENIELGMGEAEIDIKQIEEKIGKFDTLNIMVGQGVWSAKFTLTKAEIMAGIIFEVEVVR